MKKILFISEGWKKTITYSFVKGIKDYIYANNLDISVYQYNTFGSLNNDDDYILGEYSLFSLPQFDKYDGIILDCNNIFDDKARDKLITDICNSGKPAVSINCHIDGFMYAGMDHINAIENIMEHLYSEHNCRDFAYIGGPTQNSENIERRKGYFSFLEKHSDCNNIIDTDNNFEYESGIKHMQYLHNSLDKMPDAYICANDNIACGLAAEAERLGYTIPADFIVTGFDNLEIAQFFDPAITTVEQDKEKIGAEAIKLLIDVICYNENKHDSLIPVICKFRESCGCSCSESTDYRSYIKKNLNNQEYINNVELRLLTLKNRIQNCNEYDEAFEAFYSFFDKDSLDGLFIILDKQLFEKNGNLLFEKRQLSMDNCCPVFGIENGIRINNNEFEKLKDLHFMTDTKCFYTIVGIHFNESLIGIIIYKNPRFLENNPYYYDIQDTFARHLHNLYIRKTMSEYTAKLQMATNAAEQANRSKSVFLARMSHEIRTPINAVIGFSELSLQNNPDPETTDYLNNIKRSSHALLAIVNEVLDISRIESGKMELSESPYYFSMIIKDVYSIFQNQADRKGLKFILNYDKDIPSILVGDKVRIREILINLLSNAMKYTKTGSVTLNINILSKEENKVVFEFEVIDTGIGIKKEDIGSVFDIFSRADEKNNEDIEGSGLGLAIVESYIKMMNGSIFVESEYGKGSTFKAIIPQVVEDPSPMILSENFADSDLDSYSLGDLKIKNTRVLLVDDNKINQKVIRLSLNHYGLEVDVAGSGPEAIDMCKKYVYPIIFMDQMMPGMDGVTAMHHIREDIDSYKDSMAKIIALTANAMAGERDKLLAQGFDEYMGKPINYTLLESNLKKFLPKENLYYQTKSIDSK